MANSSRKPEKIDDDMLRAIVGAEITSAVGYLDGTIARERANALKYYRSEQFGNEIDGRSKVVLSDVQDTVEWIMPSLMRIFLSGTTACKYMPRSERDEAECEQKTDYANYVMFKQNKGFRNFYMWFKDALLQKNGIMKVFWYEEDKTEQTQHTGLTEDELVYIIDQPVEGDIRIVASNSYDGEASGDIVPVLDEMGQAVLDEYGSPTMAEAPPPTLWDVTLERTWTHKQIKTDPVPPEEFLISRDARSMENARFVGHRFTETVSWGISQGFDRDQLLALSETGANFGLANTEYINRRHQEYEFARSGSPVDEATREVVFIEAYIDLDRDGDGHAEKLQVFVAGDSHEVLKKENGDAAIERMDTRQPFVDLTPIIMPHVFFGRSMYDLVGDLQLIRSTMLRAWMDNLYGLNNNRVAVSNKVDLDDLLNKRPDGVVRVDTDMPDAQGHIVPMPVQPIGQAIIPALEYIETVSEKRSGVIRLNQGLDAETLDDTMGGQARLMGQANQRIELIARTFAETGVTELFDMIAKLSIAHQDKATAVKLRDKWVDVDPRTWNAEYNIEAQVGLGYDTREQEAFAMERLLEKQMTALTMQGDAEGPIVTLPHVSNTLDRYTSALGIKETGQHWADPESPEMKQVVQAKQQQAAQQAQQGDPAMALAQGQIQNDQAKVKVDAGKAAADDAYKREKLESDERIAVAKIEADAAIKREQIVASMQETAAKIQADDAKAAQSLQAKAEDTRQQIEADAFNRELDREEARKNRDIASAEKQISLSRGEDGSLSGTVSTVDEG